MATQIAPSTGPPHGLAEDDVGRLYSARARARISPPQCDRHQLQRRHLLHPHPPLLACELAPRDAPTDVSTPPGSTRWKSADVHSLATVMPPDAPSAGPPLGKPAKVRRLRSGGKVRWAEACLPGSAHEASHAFIMRFHAAREHCPRRAGNDATRARMRRSAD